MAAKNVDEELPPPITGKVLNSPVKPTGLNNVAGVDYVQTGFTLTEADFIYLKSRSSMTSEVSLMLFSAWVGFALGLMPKLLEWARSGENNLSRYELISLFGILALNALLYVVGWCFPSEKTRLMRRMKKHFSVYRPSKVEE